MRVFVVLLLGLALQFAATDRAEARRARGAETEELHFVADTTVEGPEQGQPLSLCHRTVKSHFFGIAYWRSSEGYALATNKCDSENYFSFNEGGFAEAQASGQIDPSLPAEPRLTTGQMIGGFWGWGLVLGGLGFFGYTVLQQQKRKKERLAEMGDVSPFAQRMLDVMCHAAKADGQLDGDEAGMITHVSEQLTGTAFAAEKIIRLVNLADGALTESAFKGFAKGMSPHEQQQLMRGALMVIAADGEFSEGERKFIGGLAAAFKMPGEQVQAIMDSLNGAQAAG